MNCVLFNRRSRPEPVDLIALAVSCRRSSESYCCADRILGCCTRCFRAHIPYLCRSFGHFQVSLFFAGRVGG